MWVLTPDLEEMLDLDVDVVGLLLAAARVVVCFGETSSSSEVQDDWGVELGGLASLLPPP